MSTDVPTPNEPGAGEPATADSAEAATRRSSPTSRARRIGGLSRPAPTPGPAPGPTPGPAPAPTPAPTSRSEDGGPDASLTEAATPDRPEPADDRIVVAVPTWLRWLPATALGAAALVMLVYFAVVSHGVWWGTASANQVRDEVLSAAKSCTAATNTWHYTSIAADETKGAACTTGTRTTDYRHGMESVVKPLAIKAKASQVAQVTVAGISGASPDGRRFTVLVVGQLDIRQASNPKGTTDPFAARVQMDRVGGRWLMSRLQEVSGPGAKTGG